jgi:predicted nucleic acid-binding Zn ribbon protein
VPSAKGFQGRRADEARGRGAPADAPSRLGEVIDELMAEQVFARGMPVARLAASWSTVVGERLASETAPAALEGRVLTVTATSGPWGAQARFLHAEIRRRADEALGGGKVDEVRIVVRNRR